VENKAFIFNYFLNIPIPFCLLFKKEAFVPGGSLESSASKPWLSEIVPEMHIKSGRDVCLGVNTSARQSKVKYKKRNYFFSFLIITLVRRSALCDSVPRWKA